MARHRVRKWNFKQFRKVSRIIFQFCSRSFPFLVFFGLSYFIFLSAKNMVHADLYFRADKIMVFPSGILTAPELNFIEEEARRKSLLEMDLKAISKSLERNPKVKRAEVIRNLSGELNIVLLTRLPFIQVQLEPAGKFFIVADDQIVLSTTELPRPNLRIMEDFSAKRKLLSTGSFYPNAHFRSLFGFFEVLKNDPVLGREVISKTMMDQIGNVSLLLSDGIELKMGKEALVSEGARVVLGSILRSNQQRSQILYIDLRYRDIIVKRKADL